MNKEVVLEFIKKNPAKITGIIIGLCFGIFVIYVGFFKTIFISLCIIIGYYFGKRIDNNESIIEILDKILPIIKLK